MPRALRACAEPDCPELVPTGRCPTHTTPAWGGGRAQRRRGSGWEWSRTRERVLRRDGGVCQIGGPGCRVVAAEVDHVDGDRHNDADGNLQSVCRPCHAAKTQAEARAARNQ